MPLRLLVVPAETLRAIAAPILWSAYVAIPARGSGWLDGVPLGPIEAAAIALVWWAWAARRRLPGERLLVAFVIAKIALSGVSVDRGFGARYYANDTWAPPQERSIEFRDGRYTRRDERLAFGGGDRSDLPLHFLNDVKFNFYLPTQPRREQLPYSVVWEGHLLVDDRRSTTVYVAADETAIGGLWIDGRPVIVLDRASPRTASVALEPGWRALRISVAAPQGAGRRFEVGEIAGGAERPFDGNRVFLRPVGPVRLTMDAAARRITQAVDVALLSWLAALVALRLWSALREAKIGRLLWLGAIVEALRYASPYDARVTVLSGGSDWLMYEHLSRVIALGDPLLQQPGPGGGQGAPFYFQPFYPYFVALTHLVFGEDLFGVVLVQRLLVAATVAWAAAMTARLFGERARWVAVIGGGLFLYEKLGRWSYVLLAEPLFTPVFVGWTWMLVKLATEPPSSGRVLLAGVAGGVATLTRSTLLLAWPLVLPLWWVSLRRRRARVAAGLVIVMAATVGAATLRNWIVSNRFVPVATSFGVNLFLGNQPPRPLAPAASERAAVYERLRLDEGTRNVIEYAIQLPGEFAANLGRKAVYTVGFYDQSGLEQFAGTAWSYAGMWLLALVGIFRISWLRPTPGSPVVWLPLVLALCHFAAVVLIFPYGYGDRLIVPLYALLISYAAIALVPLVTRVEPYAVRGGTASAAVARRHQRRLASVVRPALGLAGAWAYGHGRAALLERRNWTYLAYSAAAIHWLSGIELIAALLLPVTAAAVARVTRQNLPHRIVGSLLWAAALLAVAAAGSRSPDALHDPLFWGLLATLALGASAIAGRWPAAARATATVAGACIATAMLLPLFPDFESTLPSLDVMTMGESITLLARQLGPLGALCLVAIWIQTIAVRGARGAGVGRIAAAARGALLVGLVLTFAGAVPGAAVDARVWLAGLGILLGLVEAKARARGPARSDG